MNRFVAFAVTIPVAAVLAIPITHSLAQQPTGNQIVLGDRTMRMSKLISSYVYDDQGRAIGSVADVLVKKGEAEPMAILSVGDYVGGGPKMVAVPLSRINLEGPKPTMAGATKEMLANMPVYLFPPNPNQSG